MISIPPSHFPPGQLLNTYESFQKCSQIQGEFNSAHLNFVLKKLKSEVVKDKWVLHNGKSKVLPNESPLLSS